METVKAHKCVSGQNLDCENGFKKMWNWSQHKNMKTEKKRRNVKTVNTERCKTSQNTKKNVKMVKMQNTKKKNGQNTIWF